MYQFDKHGRQTGVDPQGSAPSSVHRCSAATRAAPTSINSHPSTSLSGTACKVRIARMHRVSAKTNAAHASPKSESSLSSVRRLVWSHCAQHRRKRRSPVLHSAKEASVRPWQNARRRASTRRDGQLLLMGRRRCPERIARVEHIVASACGVTIQGLSSLQATSMTVANASGCSCNTFSKCASTTCSELYRPV